MIVGPGYRFIENPKTGSTSIAKWLGAHAGGKRPPARVWPRHSFPFAKDGSVLTFGVVRDPVDRMVSAWRRKHYSTPFPQWLRSSGELYVGGIDFLRTPQVAWLRFCDAVLDFSNLGPEFDVLADRLDWDGPLLYHENRAVADRFEVSDEDRALIADRFAPDYARWGAHWRVR